MRTIPSLSFSRLLLGAAALSLGSLTASAQEIALDTTYASGNGQSGNMFDVVATDSLVITRVDAHIDAGNWNVEVYWTPGGYGGKQSNPGAWTLLGSVPVIGGGDVSLGGVKTPIPLALNLPVAAGQTVGMYVTLSDGSAMNYTNGSLEGSVFVSDSSVSILEGLGVAYPFSGNFSPRVWNGTLYYSQDCDGNGIADDQDILNNPTADIDGDGNLDVCVAPPLMADVYTLSVAAGGVQNFALTAPNPGDIYMLLGSTSGTTPGMAAGPFTLPLNQDIYFMHTLIRPNINPLTNSYSTFNPGPGAVGVSTATFTLQPNYDPILVGLTSHHAFVVMDATTGDCTSVSNPVPITFLP
jgi:hypothetical protein